MKISGIYSLVFEGYEHLPYIGMTSDFEERCKTHKSSILRGNANYKVMDIYNKTKTLPIITLIEETQDLKVAEQSWIKEFDSIKNGLNITTGGDSSGSGYQHARSKFTREQVLEVFKLLQDVWNSTTFISRETGVSTGIIGDISRGKTHEWLQEEFPDEYAHMLSLIGKRKAKRILNDDNSFPALRAPDGTIHYFESLSKFAEEQGFHSAQGFYGLLNGDLYTYKDWTLAKALPIKSFKIIAPNGEVHEVKNMSAFGLKHNISKQALSRMRDGKQSSTRDGWTISKST